MQNICVKHTVLKNYIHLVLRTVKNTSRGKIKNSLEIYFKKNPSAHKKDFYILTRLLK